MAVERIFPKDITLFVSLIRHGDAESSQNFGLGMPHDRTDRLTNDQYKHFRDGIRRILDLFAKLEEDDEYKSAENDFQTRFYSFRQIRTSPFGRTVQTALEICGPGIINPNDNSSVGPDMAMIRTCKYQPVIDYRLMERGYTPEYIEISDKLTNNQRKLTLEERIQLDHLREPKGNVLSRFMNMLGQARYQAGHIVGISHASLINAVAIHFDGVPNLHMEHIDAIQPLGMATWKLTIGAGSGLVDRVEFLEEYSTVHKGFYLRK